MIIIIDYNNRRKYYIATLSLLEQLDKKALLGEVIEEANFADGEILYNVIKEVTKSMNDEINKEKFSK